MSNIKEIQKEQQVALIDYTQYIKLNESLSKVKKYPNKGTWRIWQMYPQLAKVNQLFDVKGNETDFDIKCVLPISNNNLENYPKFFEGLELISLQDAILYESELDLFELDGLTTEQIDWFLENYNEQGYYKEDLTFILGDEQPSNLKLIQNLVDKGLVIGVYE